MDELAVQVWTEFSIFFKIFLVFAESKNMSWRHLVDEALQFER